VRSWTLLCSLVLLAACGDDDPATGTPGPANPQACTASPAPVRPASSCNVAVTAQPVVEGNHVPEGTPIAYCTNPPSSGTHYSVWAAFKEYAAPVDTPYLVHSMEHGAVVLFYKCETACPEIVAELRRLKDAMPKDPECIDVNARVILAPSTTIPSRVAAAAWGATYAADCVDAPSLDAFMRDHYAKGPEDLCAAGRSF
jgi:hypothetical protein